LTAASHKPAARNERGDFAQQGRSDWEDSVTG